MAGERVGQLLLGTPVRLFSTNHVLPLGGLPNCAVMPDGSRFLLVKDEAQLNDSEPVQLVAVLNWFAELEAHLTRRFSQPLTPSTLSSDVDSFLQLCGEWSSFRQLARF